MLESHKQGAEMRKLMPPSAEEKRRLVEAMTRDVCQHLHDYALALKFRDEILAVTRASGGAGTSELAGESAPCRPQTPEFFSMASNQL